MENDKTFTVRIKDRIDPYIQSLPGIVNYQIVTKAVLAVWLFLLGRIFQALLRSSGRVAVTSGDWKFLFTTWQGLFILLLGVISLYVYVAFDLNAKIAVSRDMLTGKKYSLEDCIREGFDAVRKLNNLRGTLVVIYIALIAPILGIGVSISLTEGLYIPTFIAAVIQDSVLYSALAGAASLVFLYVGISNLFILHGIVIDKLSVAEAGLQSMQLIRANWKNYLRENVLFVLVLAAAVTSGAVIALFIPIKLISIIPLPAAVSRLLTIFFVLAGTVVSVLVDMVAIPWYLLKMTQLFFSYKQGSEYRYQPARRDRERGSRRTVIIIAVIVVAAVLFVNDRFDQLFPLQTDVGIIAHRAGGDEGAENTIAGLDAAYSEGAYGSEIDVQRTKDGYYILNHDGNFRRVAGDKRKPDQMLLSEVRELSVDGEPVPTFEEMLLSARGRMVLFTELKGKTADRKMADDVVSLIKQYQMEDECVVISLKYDVIDYVETTYPEIQTGFLTFASFGRTADLNCDYIGLEEESATADAIRSIHYEGKKVLVWTANDPESQKHFMCTRIDGLITDKVSQAMRLRTEIAGRSDIERMVDTIRTLF